MMQSSMQYGHVSGNGGQDPGKKKRLITIGISSMILVAMVVAVTVGISNKPGSALDESDENVGSGDGGNVQASMKAIEAICQPTDYKKTCVDSLSAAAGNVTDPKQLIQIGLNVTISKIMQAAKNSSVLQQMEKDPRASKALQNCKQLMEYAVGDLTHSLEQLGVLDVNKVDDLLIKLKIWISASGTYLETCLDGFEKTEGNAGASMRKALNTSAELVSNALAIVTEISSVLNSLQIPVLNRRLLSNDEGNLPHPSNAWISTGQRRLLEEPPDIKPNVVVAQDGSGKYKTITEALKEVPPKNNQTFIIYIREGIYNEHVEVLRAMPNVMMIGDGPNKTKITGNENFVDGTPTFQTATFVAIGDNFMAKDIGFENSAGPEKHQAVALRVQSDMSIFYNCQMDGYQDTLYTHTKRQFYRNCVISGTIDFVFGDAAVVLQNCKFIVRKPMDNQQNIVTAQGRKDQREPTGIVLQDCLITTDPLYFPLRTKLKSYLGRPWKEFSRTIIMNTVIEDLIQPEGWLPWMGEFGINTCFYSEISNTGPGSNMDRRVKWPGVKTVPPNEAIDYSPGKFINGDTWIPDTGVPYTSGLSAD